MAKFLMSVDINAHEPAIAARLGAGSGSANQIDDKEVGKAVKLAGESRYNLCAVGDPIEGFIESVEAATLDDFSFGAVRTRGRKYVTFDGLQATPGTGAIAVGDYVVCGTVVAKGTALSSGVPVKVCKATVQPGTTEAAAVADVNEHIKVTLHAWRVVSLGTVGTGAVGTVGLIERVR